jgi:hypothetical protein
MLPEILHCKENSKIKILFCTRENTDKINFANRKLAFRMFSTGDEAVTSQ